MIKYKSFATSIHFLAIFCFMAIILSSCSSNKNVLYFKDIKPGATSQVLDVKNISLKAKDKISIIVNSKDPLLSDLFNLSYVTRQLGNSTYNGGYRNSQGVSLYTVDSEGCIDFPVLGKLHVEGLSREQVVKLIKDNLINKNLVKDPIVTVEFMNLTFSVIGEVNHPGRFSIDKDNMTILEALSMAGDLTIFGERNKIFVQREEGDKRTMYQVDINSGKDLYTSPVYYLQQNDIVYVEPNTYRTKDSTVNNKALRWSSILIAFGSLLTTITIAITK